jgi:hypothetical protein
VEKNDINRNPSGKPEGFLKEGEYEIYIKRTIGFFLSVFL